MRVKSLLVPPGIPDFYYAPPAGGARAQPPLYGRAWSGAGVPIARVEVGVDGAWHEAALDATAGQFAWRGWRCAWNARAGEHELCLPRHRRQRRDAAAGARAGTPAASATTSVQRARSR